MEKTIKGTDIKPLFAWTIGFINETKDVLMVAETRDGGKITLGMPADDAIAIGRALVLQGEKSKASQ